MSAPKTLPLVYDDTNYKDTARCYAANKAKDLRVGDIERIIARAYLDGAQSALRVGYMLAEKDFEETVKYYKSLIKKQS